MPLAYAQKIYNNVPEKKNSHPHHKKYFMLGYDIATYEQNECNIARWTNATGYAGHNK